MATPSREERAHTGARRLGFWAAVTTTLLVLVTFGIAIATPPRSGPNCTFDVCLEYPYTDIAAYFPRDYIWMFPATLVLVAFVALVVCIHHYAPVHRRPLSLIAVVFAAMAATVLAVDYYIQLRVVQTAVSRGETEGLPLLTQYNPDGIFIALEELGYLMMSFAFLFMAPAFVGRSILERVLRWLLTAAFVAAAVSLPVMALLYGHDLAYRYEILVITIDWITLIVAGILLSILFRRGSSDHSST